MIRTLLLILALALAGMTPQAQAAAIGPDEVLDDPELEARARAIMRDLRCVVCRSEAIDESNAELARDLRMLVRERVVAGDSDAEIFAFMQARYGDFVLMRPPMTAQNAALWLSAPVLLLAGAAIALVYIRRRSRIQTPEAPRPLSAEERARLARLLDD